MTATIPADRLKRGLWWGEAWSLVEGCTPVSEGCAHCWSAAATHMRSSNPNPATASRYAKLTNVHGRFSGAIRVVHADLDKPLKRKKPTVFSVWNDLFHPGVASEFVLRVFDVMSRCPQHLFSVCTKRPERAWPDLTEGYYSTPPDTPGIPLPNVILMTTVENQARADERIPHLLKCPARYRALSVEPMLGPVDLRFVWEWGEGRVPEPWLLDMPTPNGRIDWIIAGCESGGDRRKTNIEWVRELLGQCQEADVPFFLKQLDIGGKVVKAPELDGQQWLQLPWESE